ncbi:leucine-rich repeat domain-containing protein [Arundinibacter roseus]|uniref:Leucine-rich repeat domain-containing protein n=1 Tax=Arundinibacter roseus TaxID=2070510 RepID=A0A4R4KCQ9_9BACT|nr:leucine-rich repeat domain-containing protein [Arundinibacter roseus]TDB64069.1 leucine-rich repeat domain-containing protein [Arundinibacter roseus]
MNTSDTTPAQAPAQTTTNLRRRWWNSLEDQWKQAFSEALWQQKEITEPTDEALQNLFSSKVLRIAGPRSFHPNVTPELTNLSGIEQLSQLEILIISDHQIEELTTLRKLHNLRDVFVFNNRIRSLDGVESLEKLEKLYVQNNRIESLQPIENLLNISELHIYNNQLLSLEGLKEHHADSLYTFICMPNEHLRRRELLRVENQLGIRCK